MHLGVKPANVRCTQDALLEAPLSPACIITCLQMLLLTAAIVTRCCCEAASLFPTVVSCCTYCKDPLSYSAQTALSIVLAGATDITFCTAFNAAVLAAQALLCSFPIPFHT